MISTRLSEEDIVCGGSLNFWRLAKSTLQPKVQEGLAALGLERYAPEPRSWMSCLRAAITDAFKSDKEEKVSVSNIENGYAVIACPKDSEPSVGDNWGRVAATVTLSGDDPSLLTLCPRCDSTYSALVSGVRSARKWLTATSVGKSLTDLIELADGVSLRPNGGVYWLAASKFEAWQDVARVFEQASALKDRDGKPAEPNCIYSLKVFADENMVRAVGDYLTDEIERALANIESEISSGDLQSRACENRLAKTNKLLEKIRRCEDVFAKPLTKLTEAVTKTGAACAIAALQATAAAQSGD